MLERLEEIKKQGLEKINSAKSSKELEEIRRELLGKKSPLTEVLKTLGSLDVETKKQVGMKANEIKNYFDEKLNEKDKSKKVERWQKISEVAAKQSGRDIIPHINNVINIKNDKIVLYLYGGLL